MRHHKVWPAGLPFSLPRRTRSVYENLLDSAQRDPDRTAVWYYGRSVSYAALLAEVQALAGYLHHKLGVGPKDRVALYMQNAPQFVVAYYAVLAANAVVVPVNPMCRGGELSHILQDSGARALVFGDELSGEVARILADVQQTALIAARYRDYIDPASPIPFPLPSETNSERAIGVPWSEALSAGLAPPDHDRQPDDWCLIPYSSGTTGRPKGCLHTHATVNATIRAYPGWVGMDSGSKVMATLPFCHVTGMQHSMNLPIFTGSTIYLMTRWTADDAADIITQQRIEHWRSITTMMIDFLSVSGIEQRDLSSLKAVGGGGAQMPESIAQKMTDLIGLPFVEAYGLTETMAPTHINPPAASKPQCLGIPIFDVDCRIVDPEKAVELGLGETGEIVTHAPQVFLGYWNQPAETQAAFLEIDGKRFFRTGDIGYFDEDGYFFFVDRLKRMVNVSGLKVWPAEVEAILHGHPDISEACIVSDPDPRTGEAVRAVIVPIDGKSDLPLAALTDWCRQNMAAYKVPKRFDFRTSLPRSAIGKVLWRDLQAEGPAAVSKA